MIKALDGIWCGDAEASYDPDFLESNKVSNLINLAGQEVQNIYAGHGLVYLTYMWEDRDDFTIFDKESADKSFQENVHKSSISPKDRSSPHRLLPQPFNEIVEFIDNSIKFGISVLIFSVEGGSRCTFALCGYLMCKYGWSYGKALQYLMAKRSDVLSVPNMGYMRQLESLDQYLLIRRGFLKQKKEQLVYMKNKAVSMIYGMIADFPPYGYSRWKEFDTKYLTTNSNTIKKETQEALAAARSNGTSSTVVAPSKDALAPSPHHVNSFLPADEEDDNELVIVLSHINTALPNGKDASFVSPSAKQKVGRRLKFDDAHLAKELGVDNIDEDFKINTGKDGVKSVLKHKIAGGIRFSHDNSSGNTFRDSEEIERQPILSANTGSLLYADDKHTAEDRESKLSDLADSKAYAPSYDMADAKSPTRRVTSISNDREDTDIISLSKALEDDDYDLYGFVGMEVQPTTMGGNARNRNNAGHQKSPIREGRGKSGIYAASPGRTVEEEIKRVASIIHQSDVRASATLNNNSSNITSNTQQEEKEGAMSPLSINSLSSNVAKNSGSSGGTSTNTSRRKVTKRGNERERVNKAMESEVDKLAMSNTSTRPKHTGRRPSGSAGAAAVNTRYNQGEFRNSDESFIHTYKEGMEGGGDLFGFEVESIGGKEGGGGHGQHTMHNNASTLSLHDIANSKSLHNLTSFSPLGSPVKTKQTPNIHHRPSSGPNVPHHRSMNQATQSKQHPLSEIDPLAAFDLDELDLNVNGVRTQMHGRAGNRPQSATTRGGGGKIGANYVSPYSASNLRRPGSANQGMQNIHSGNTGNTASGMYRQKPTNVMRPGSATSRSSVNNRESPVTRIARDRSVGSIQSGMSALSNASAGKKTTPKRRVVVRR